MAAYKNMSILKPNRTDTQTCIYEFMTRQTIIQKLLLFLPLNSEPLNIIFS